MKKFLLTLLLLVSLGMTAMAEVATVKTNSSTITNNNQAVNNGDITISYTSDTRYDATLIRVYAGKTVTFTGAEGITIEKIEFTTTGKYAFNFSANEGSVDNTSKTWTGSAQSVVLTNKSNAQVRFTDITITYTNNAGPKEPVDFSFDGFKDYTLKAGKSVALELPSNAPTITYTSSNEAVATVTDNTINALAVGSTTITASWAAVAEKWNEGNAVFTVTVEEAPEISGWQIVFKSEGSDGSTDLTNNTFNSHVESGAEYVASVTDISKVYQGTNGLKFSSSKTNGKITLNLSEAGKVICSEIKVIWTAWGSDDASLTVNGLNGTKDADGVYTYTYATPTELSTIVLNATKRLYVKSIEVVEAKAAEPALEGDVTCTVKRSKYGWLSANYSFSVANYDGHEIVVTMKVLDAQGNEVQGLSFENVEPAAGPVRAASQAFSGTILAKGEALGTPENPATENFTVALSATADGKPLFTDAKTESNVATGIEDVIVNENAPAEYFNLQGVRVSEPQAGQLYIKRQGNKATKVRF